MLTPTQRKIEKQRRDIGYAEKQIEIYKLRIAQERRKIIMAKNKIKGLEKL